MVRDISLLGDPTLYGRLDGTLAMTRDIDTKPFRIVRRWGIVLPVRRTIPQISA